MLNDFKRPDRHQQALAILAIATAAIGVGLFGGGLKLAGPSEELSGVVLALSIARSFALLAAIGTNFAVFTSVHHVLGIEGPVTGREIVGGPLLWLYWEMLSLALIFLVNAYLTILT